MTQKSCGLSVSQDVEVMFTDTHTCKGSISDWNAKTCQPESKLTMHLSGCSKFNWRGMYDHIILHEHYELKFTLCQQGFLCDQLVGHKSM